MVQSKTFPLNALDIKFLLSSDGKILTDLPNSITLYFRLKRTLNRKRLVDTLVLLDEKYPSLKLSTVFDAGSLSWVPIKSDKRKHFDSVISIEKTETSYSVEEFVSLLIKKNNYDVPFEIIIYNEFFYFRQNHIFGDGMFALRLVELIFSVYFEGIESVHNLRLADELSYDLLQIKRTSMSEEKATSALNEKENIHPHFIGSIPRTSVENQHVVNTVITSEQLKILEKIRREMSTTLRISMNTLINILFTYWFAKNGFQNKKTNISIPAHLASYFDKDVVHPYNFITNIELYIETPRDVSTLIDVTRKTQKRIDDLVKNRQLLINVASDMEKYSRLKKKHIQKLQAKYIQSFDVIEQTFVISTIGITDTILKRTKHYMEDFHVFICAPTIGSQPLQFFILRINGQANISCIVDESRVDRNIVLELFDFFSEKFLAALYKQIRGR